MDKYIVIDIWGNKHSYSARCFLDLLNKLKTFSAGGQENNPNLIQSIKKL
jgi:hypothetical protein